MLVSVTTTDTHIAVCFHLPLLASKLETKISLGARKEFPEEWADWERVKSGCSGNNPVVANVR